MIWLLTTEALILTLVGTITVQARRSRRFHQLQQLPSVNSRAALLRSRIHLVHSRSGRTQVDTPRQTVHPARPVLEFRASVESPTTRSGMPSPFRSRSAIG
jgi:hypothetical protein